MKSVGLAFLLVLSHVVISKIEGGQVRSVCILIPAYDPAEFAEGENEEEEEVTGWGPGPAPASTNHRTIVTHSHGGQADGGGGLPPSGGDNSTGAAGGAPQGPMRDRSKPPGPNPKWGYWEWDGESGQWELEDFRRKRRQAAGAVLAGKLQCGPGTVTHVDTVTLGFSMDNRCRPVRAGCQATSTLGRQVSQCEGQTGACAVTVSQTYLHQCGRRTNYAKIQYECIPEVERHNICEAKSFQSTGSLVLSSPSFSGSVADGAQAQYLSCECEVTKGDNAALAVPWVRTQLDTGEGTECGEELLLLDTWDNNVNRFALQEELCGLTSRRNTSLSSSVVKLTYIPSSTYKATNGFLLRIQGKPDAKAKLQVTCSVVPADDGPAPQAAGPPPPPPAPPSGGSAASATVQVGQRPGLPLNFDIRNYPGLLNKTLTAWRSRMNQDGSAAGQMGGDPSVRQAGATGAVVQDGSNTAPADEFDVTGTSGTLSAVVASLSSIIVILGSIGVFLWYRRSQKKKQKKNPYFDTRSTIRSTATLYSEAIYQDPAGPGSNIPSTLPCPLPSPLPSSPSFPSCRPELGANDDHRNHKTSDSLQTAAGRKASADGQPPPLPVRPPRTKKNRCHRLASEEEVTYDNAAGCGGVKAAAELDTAVYTSLDEVSASLTSQDAEVQTNAAANEQAESKATEVDENQTEA